MLQLRFDNSHWINIVSQTAWNFVASPAAVSKSMNINHGKEAPPVLCQANQSTLLHFPISPSFRKEMAEVSRLYSYRVSNTSISKNNLLRMRDFSRYFCIRNFYPNKKLLLIKKKNKTQTNKKTLINYRFNYDRPIAKSDLENNSSGSSQKF